MSNYILISSAYRDRLMYPNPADFIVPFQLIQSSIVNEFSVLNTVNPISIYPIYNFCWTNYSTGKKKFKTVVKGGSGYNIELGENVQDILLGLKPNQQLHLEQDVTKSTNILKGYKIKIFNQKDQNIYESYILSYLPIYNMIMIAEPIPFNISDPINIINDSEIESEFESIITLNGEYNTTLFLNNELYLYNITINEIRKCRYDDIQNKLICTPGYSKKIGYTDKYLIYNNYYPFIMGELLKFMNGKYYIEDSLLTFNLVQKGQGYKINEIVYCVSSISDDEEDSCLFIVKRIGNLGCIEELQMNMIGCQNFKRSHYYYIKPMDKRQIEYASIYIINTATALRCKIKGNRFQRNDFIGNYFTCFLLSPLYNINENELYTSPNNIFPVNNKNQPIDLYQSQQVTGVSGICNVLLLSTSINNEYEVIIFVNKISSVLLYRFALYEKLMIKESPIFADALHFCIQNFKNEGVVPLNFSGTYLTQSQMSCYEITILNLILPNRELDALNSLLTTGFPYVLLEISNVTQPNSGNRNVIYSNNPAVVTSTFVCSISDVNNPLTTKFIKISSDGTIQTIKFSPADNLKFRILLPSGDIFDLKENDYLPPSLPDPRLQIEALIELKRL